MILKKLIDEDFINYKKPSMFVGFPSCTFKCEKESGVRVCQNSALALSPDIEIKAAALVDRYISNSITTAVVCGGLEPADSFAALIHFIDELRVRTNDDVVIYTGYREDEMGKKIETLQSFVNIIVKYGRYVPNQEAHYDDVLGVYLSSPNQYAVKIS